MITTKLMGGLGNYMFQIATAISLAIDNKDDVVFYSKGSTQVHKHITNYTDNIFRNVTILDKLTPTLNRYDEPTFSYREIPYKKDSILLGYFQSEKYFKHNRYEILSSFSPSHVDLSYIHDKYGSLLSKDNTCSIHVRRGDYLSLKDHHPTCTMDYYNEGMSKMSKDTIYLIFSDDIEWCKKNFIGKEFIFIEDEVDVIDLHLMSYCKNNIIANSTFSWWGAWLNKNKSKTVVAPIKWFGSAKGNMDTSDIYVDNWIRI